MFESPKLATGCHARDATCSNDSVEMAVDHEGFHAPPSLKMPVHRIAGPDAFRRLARFPLITSIRRLVKKEGAAE